MQKLLSRVLAILSRMLSRSEMPRSARRPNAYRPRQVARAAEPKIRLKLLSPAERRKFGPVVGASIGTVVVAGFSGPALAQSEESCAFVWELRSPYTVERVLRNFPTDPCIPIMLEALPFNLLTRIDIDLIRDLPASTLNKVDADVLEDLGISRSRGIDRDDDDDDDDDYPY